MRLAILLLLLAAAPAWGQSVKLPAEVKGAVGAFVVIEAETTDTLVKWHSVDAGLNLFPPHLLKDSKIAVVTALLPGRYRVLAVSAKADVPSDFTLCTVVIGDAPVPPPPPPPIVPPDPIEAGPRTVLLIRESADSTPEVSRLINNLRSGPAADYLKSKGHSLFILDDDSLDASGKPSRIVESWRKHFQGMTLPVLLIVDKNGALVHKVSLPNSTAASDVLTVLKSHGG